MQIRSLAVTNRPLWINVQQGHLERIEFKATLKFWPEDSKNVALFLIEFDGDVTPDELIEHGITSSGIGSYVYLNVPGTNGEFDQQIHFPKANVKRIGIRLWGRNVPLVLEQITIDATGAVLASEYQVSEDTFLEPAVDANGNAGLDMLALSLRLHDGACNAYCHAVCRNWYDTMDEVARRYRDDDVGRVNGWFRVPDAAPVPVTVYNGTPAMLRIPSSHAEYFEKIGDKARNMIRKAQRQGYAYRRVDPDTCLDDVLAIRTSDPERQGKPIPDYYKIRPERMMDEPFNKACGMHGEEFFGVFKDDRLVAYATIFLYGELGQVNHILGHAQHLQEGVMNLLVSEMVRELIERRPYVKAINYLYPHAANANTGIGLFKRSIGFLPEKVLVHGTQDLSHYVSRPQEQVPSKPVEPPSEKKLLRATTSKAVKVAETEHALIHPPAAKNRAQALDAALQALSQLNPALRVLACRSVADLARNDFAAMAAHVVVFDGLPFEGFKEFLSTGLKGFRKVIPKESFLVFGFKRHPLQGRSDSVPVLAKLVPFIFKRKTRRLRQDLLDYLEKRFKSLDLSIDDIKTGFKGSDYVVAGVADYDRTDRGDDFDSWLILRKIR